MTPKTPLISLSFFLQTNDVFHLRVPVHNPLHSAKDAADLWSYSLLILVLLESAHADPAWAKMRTHHCECKMTHLRSYSSPTRPQIFGVYTHVFTRPPWWSCLPCRSQTVQASSIPIPGKNSKSSPRIRGKNNLVLFLLLILGPWCLLCAPLSVTDSPQKKTCDLDCCTRDHPLSLSL